jgi:hypothetical protein
MIIGEKNKRLLYSWLPIKTYHKNWAIWKQNSSKSSKFGPFLWKILFKGRHHFFMSKFYEISALKKLGCTCHPLSFNPTNECKHLKKSYCVQINKFLFIYLFCMGRQLSWNGLVVCAHNIKYLNALDEL